MDKIIEFFVGLYDQYVQLIRGVFPDLYNNEWILLAALGVLILLIVALITAATRSKKIIFIAEGRRYAVTKSKKNKPINFPEDPYMEGYEFKGWFKDKKCKKPYVKTVIKGKTNLETIKLYAKFEPVVAEKPNDNIDLPSADVATAPVVQEVPQEQPQVAQEVPQEQPQVEVPVVEQQAEEPSEVAATQVSAEEEVESTEETEPAIAFQPIAVDDAEEEPAPEVIEPVVVAPAEPVVAAPIAQEPTAVETISAADEQSQLGKFYDELRYTMLGYERAPEFKKLGLQRKQVIAQMFESNGTINLYLAVSPELMEFKGHNVLKYDRPEFAVAPCKKIIRTKDEFEEALALIKDAMLVNNLVKNGANYPKTIISTEETRKSGFALFVKNENVATTAADYYRLLKAVVLSYRPSANSKITEEYNNKMILKLMKDGETIKVYLALDANAEGLKSVAHAVRFADTPAMFEVNTSADCKRASEFIDKLMTTYGMEKLPNSVEISLDEQIDYQCGFGFRIKR